MELHLPSAIFGALWATASVVLALILLKFLPRVKGLMEEPLDPPIHRAKILDGEEEYHRELGG